MSKIHIACLYLCSHQLDIMLPESSQSVILSLSHNQFPCETGLRARSISMTVKTGPPKILNNKCLNDLFRITCGYAMVCVTE